MTHFMKNTPDDNTSQQDRILLSQNVLQALFDTMPVGIIVSDAQGNLLTNNAVSREILGNAVTGDIDHPQRTHTTHRIDGTPLPTQELPLRRALINGEVTQDLEILIRRADGSERVILTAAAPVYDDKGQIINGVVIFQDITIRHKLEQETREHTQHLALLNQLERTLTTTLNLSELLANLLEASLELVSADGGSVWLLDDIIPGWLVCRMAEGYTSGEGLVQRRVQIGEGIIGHVAQHGEWQLVAPIREKPRFSQEIDILSREQPGSTMALPLRSRKNIVGVLEISSIREDAFDGHDRVLLENLSSGAAFAIENALTYAAAQETAVLAERNHLAHELHDAVSQLLFSASVIAESLPRLWERNPERVRQGLTQLHQLTKGALAEMRTLLLELRPTTLMNTSLGELLNQLTDAIRGRTRLKVDLTVKGSRTLPADVRVALYRIVQEALNNIIKHARASRVTISLVNEEDIVTLCIADDGKGFDPAAVLPGHMGISIMRERAESAGISLDVQSRVGRGTKIVATWSGPERR
jgi:PAS domain S-box-containing protein